MDSKLKIAELRLNVMLSQKQHLIQMLITAIAGTIGLMFVRSSFLSMFFIIIGFVFCIIVIKLLNNLSENIIQEIKELEK